MKGINHMKQKDAINRDTLGDIQLESFNHPIKQTYDHFMIVKADAESIAESINHYPLSEIENQEKLNQLINTIETYRDNILSHLHCIDEIINSPV